MLEFKFRLKNLNPHLSTFELRASSFVFQSSRDKIQVVNCGLLDLNREFHTAIFELRFPSSTFRASRFERRHPGLKLRVVDVNSKLQAVSYKIQQFQTVGYNFQQLQTVSYKFQQLQTVSCKFQQKQTVSYKFQVSTVENCKLQVSTVANCQLQASSCKSNISRCDQSCIAVLISILQPSWMWVLSDESFAFAPLSKKKSPTFLCDRTADVLMGISHARKIASHIRSFLHRAQAHLTQSNLRLRRLQCCVLCTMMDKQKINEINLTSGFRVRLCCGMCRFGGSF